MQLKRKFQVPAFRHAMAGMVLLLPVIVFFSLGCGADVQMGDGGAEKPSEEADGNAPVVEIETTLGRFKVKLDSDQAPITTANFLRYVEDGYYEGTAVHQVVQDAMIGSGAYTSQLTPKSEGLRDPIPSEWSEGGTKNVRGAIGMYRKPGEPDSAQSEFFIILKDNPRLDEPRDGAGYLAFGEVIEGMDVIDRIGATQLQAHPGNPNGPPSVPIVPIMIVSTRILGDYDLASLEAQVNEQLNQQAAEREAFQKEQESQMQNIIDQTKEEFGVDFTTTASGLMHATLREGDGPTPPSSSSNVKVHYKGTLTNGKQFDSSYDRNAPATFPLNRVIPGWTEGVGSMKVGEKRRLIIPSDLGYGDRGAPPDIPGKATLVFDVELLEIL